MNNADYPEYRKDKMNRILALPRRDSKWFAKYNQVKTFYEIVCML